MMRQKGWQVEGIELDLSVPNPAHMPIRYGDFLTMQFDSSGYDCITMWAVLEHVYAPDKFVRRVAELLRPGGGFIALVTNFNSIQRRFFRMDNCPRHLTFFAKGAIRLLCRRHGLNVARVKTDQRIFGVASMVGSCTDLSGYSVTQSTRGSPSGSRGASPTCSAVDGMGDHLHFYGISAAPTG